MNLNTLLRRGAIPACLAAALSLPALAGPGAHGPNGEHLDAPAAVLASGDAAPRVGAHSDAFELVGTLARGELSLFIDRFASNEPVLNAKVEVESGPARAIAKFRPSQGDYAVDDAAFLKQVGQPGSHALMVTVVAGQDSDLLDGTLQVSATARSSRAGDGAVAHRVTSVGARPWVMPAALAAGAAALVAIGWVWRRGGRNASREAAL
jgi:hypothetical protein